MAYDDNDDLFANISEDDEDLVVGGEDLEFEEGFEFEEDEDDESDSEESDEEGLDNIDFEDLDDSEDLEEPEDQVEEKQWVANEELADFEISDEGQGEIQDFDIEEPNELDKVELGTVSDLDIDLTSPDNNIELSSLDDEIERLKAELAQPEGESQTPNGDNLSASDLEALLAMKEQENSQKDTNETDGEAIIESDALLGNDGELELVAKDADFLSDTGEIVLMDPAQSSEDNFKLIYIDIENIAIVKRIRIGNNVADLVQSIKSTGLLKPIDVAPTNAEGVYVLLDGFRRVVACARCGKRRIPCVVNMKVNVPEIPIIEAMYNHCKPYTVKEMISYIEYLEKEKGIMSASMIEYLLQMNSGDYTKLKDVLNDGDEDIVSKLLNGQYTIEMAFKKLEQRRKKESTEEKEIKKAEKVYGDEEASGASHIAESGEIAEDGPGLTDDELKELAIGADSLDEGLEDSSLDDMVEEGKKMDGFEPHKQKPGEREFIDPAIKKAVLARDNFTCAACKCGGESFVSAIDFHHILPVFLGGPDSADNGLTLCLTCHHLVHEYATGDLVIPKEKPEEELDKLSNDERVIYKNEQMRFKRIVKLGTVIREGMAKLNISREKYKKEHPNASVGRIKPGHAQNRA